MATIAAKVRERGLIIQTIETIELTTVSMFVADESWEMTERICCNLTLVVAGGEGKVIWQDQDQVQVPQ